MALTWSFYQFELCCGVFFPCMSSLRAQIVPGQTRATIMSLFRVPLNILVLFVLINVRSRRTLPAEAMAAVRLVSHGRSCVCYRSRTFRRR